MVCGMVDLSTTITAYAKTSADLLKKLRIRSGMTFLIPYTSAGLVSPRYTGTGSHDRSPPIVTGRSNSRNDR